MDLDKNVIPMVQYFNDQGLKTIMSCEGHSTPNMSMFWIQFDNSIQEDDILTFQKKHSNRYKSGEFFCSCGRFALRIYYTSSGIQKSWNYFAANVEAANEDLKNWRTV